MSKVVEASLLSFDRDKMQEQLDDLKAAGITHIHYDVMDGKFVSNTAFNTEYLDLISNNGFAISVHFMVMKPFKWIKKFAKHKIEYITFHPEPVSALTTWFCLKYLRHKKIAPGLAIKPKTDINKYKKQIAKVSIVTIMGVEPGFGGQSFMPESLENLKKAKHIKETLNKNLIIQVDGGVNFNVINQTKEFVDYFVSGSFLMKYEGDKKNIVLEVQKIK